MARRALLILIAIAMAGLGTFLLLRYVAAADVRAAEGLEFVDVYVAQQTIPAFTPVEEITDDFAIIQQVVSDDLVDGPVVNLDDVAGRQTSVDILPGEQLAAARFVTPEEAAPTPERIEPPDNFLEVTFQLPEARLIGGQVEPGDTVAFIASFNPFAVDTQFQEPGIDDEFTAVLPEGGDETTTDGETIVQTPNVTHILLHKVLVTNLQYAEPPALVDEEGNPIPEDDREAPNTNLMVTLAAPAPDIEKMVFVSEFGLIYLALETPDDSEEGTQIVTRGNIYRS